MISRQKIQFNITREYIRRYQASFDPGSMTSEAQRFLLVLRIRLWQLDRFLRSDANKPEHLPTLREGIRRAEYLLDGLAADDQTADVRKLASLLWMIAHELSSEVRGTEAELPHLRLSA